MRILFISTGLGTGGAEKQLAGLLGTLQERGIKAGVISLASPGMVSREIAALGVPLWHLKLEQPWHLPQGVIQLITVARKFQPDLLQGWMYHGNLAALVVKWALGVHAPVVWGVRQSLCELKLEKPRTRAMIRLSAGLSPQVNAIVYNAHLSRQQHEAYGFVSSLGRVIGNGFDVEFWRPDLNARISVRKELGVAMDTPLIGLIARYHPMKGHEVFLEAARRVDEVRPDVHFVLVGKGVGEDTPLFAQWMEQFPTIARRVHLLGERRDIPRLTASLDIASSSSWGEGFSNTIGEALLCEVPVVVTDVGEAREIVGDAGRIVQPGDAKAMAKAWDDLLALDFQERRQIGMIGRNRIRNKHGANAVAQHYLELYRGLVE